MESHMNRKFVFLIILGLLGSFSAHGLVDYSESESVAPSKSPRPKASPRKVSKASKPRSSSAGPSYTPSGMFDLGMTYKSIDVKADETVGKVNVMEVNGHMATNFNIFLDFKYWQASTDIEELTSDSGSQEGNPEVLLGFNWLQFGGGEDGTSVDLLFGGRFSSSSELASSRTDKIFGIESIKRFYTFALGLGYRLYMTGTPEDEEEVDIGNIQKLYATFGWMVSHDISFEIEGAVFNIGNSNSVTRANILETKESFGTISPTLNLRLGPMVGLGLGATFRTDKVSDTEKLVGARLWDMSGVYGSSIHAGLDISI